MCRPALLLTLGFSASAAVVIRIPYLHDYHNPDFLCMKLPFISYPTSFPPQSTTLLTASPFPDATANISIWSNVEASLGITAGSLVALRPLFRFFRDGSFHTSRSVKRTNTSILLSNMSGRDPTGKVKQGPNEPGYWRPDIYPDDAHAVVTAAVNSDRRKHRRRNSTNSSQEDLNPKGEDSSNGVSVQKTFVVTSNAI